MRISDIGLKHILSLGHSKETDRAGVYYLYTWNDVSYYCGLSTYEESFEKSKGVYISLTAEQLTFFSPIKKRKKESDLSSILSLYETAVFFKYNQNLNTFTAEDCKGALSSLRHLNISLGEASPFKVVLDTQKPFHGFYSPLGTFSESLKSLGVNLEHLWLTLFPVILNGQITGVLLGASQQHEYGVDSLNVFKDFLEAS